MAQSTAESLALKAGETYYMSADVDQHKSMTTFSEQIDHMLFFIRYIWYKAKKNSIK